MEEKVVLINEKDEQIGLMDKMEAHEKALLHRAFSVFIINKKKELLLQQRAAHKYHSPLLWTNTCCSHQRDGESNITAGKRRLQEEMGFQTELKELYSFIYKAPFDNGLTEHECDHVMIGYYNNDPIVKKKEVKDFKWVKLQKLQKDMEINPEKYTVWFKITFNRFCEFLNEKNNEKNNAL